MTTGAKWGIGAGVGCLVVLVAVALLGLAGGRFVRKQTVKAEQRRQLEESEFREAMRARGFINEVKGQAVSIEEDIVEPTLYDAQTFKFWGRCTTDLCVVAQVCEIYGTVEGTLVFKGQSLIIQPNGVVEGDLEVDAQTVERHGKVLGKVSGSYQTFKD